MTTSSSTPAPARKSNRPLQFMFGCTIVVVAICMILGAISKFTSNPNPFSGVSFASRLMSFGSDGTGQSQFQDACCMGVDGKGNIIVADAKDGRVQIFTSKGNFVSMFTVPGPIWGGPAYIYGIAVDPDGKIYIASKSRNAILAYDESGNSLGVIGDGQDSYYSTALGTDHTLYALTSSTIYKFTPDSSAPVKIPVYWAGQSGDSLTSQLAVDSTGNIYVTNFDTSAINKYSPQGKLIAQFSASETKVVPNPTRIAIDQYGRIFINTAYKDVQVLDANGKLITIITGRYDGLAFDQQNNLYIGEIGDVVKFQTQKPNP